MQLSDWSDDVGGLRRFGCALVRDERNVLDEASAMRLVDKLLRQLSLTALEPEGGQRRSSRVGAFGRFVRLYRRHMRRQAFEDYDGWPEPTAPHPGQFAQQAVRSLPLEQREALLIVVIAAFTHSEAAEALDISLTQLVDRLDRARDRLRRAMGAAAETPADVGPLGPPYLRVIK